MTFDPYYTWLGIPPRDQPPSHYRLLAIEPLETNADVISNAADRLMTYLRGLGNGPHASEAQQLLNEVSAARLCLLSPQEKSQYDAGLRSQPQEPVPPPVATAPPPVRDPRTPPLLPSSERGPLRVPQQLGDYEILDEISRGTKGTFYRARRTRGELVALKVLSDVVTQSPELFARFQRKVGILRALRHENIVCAVGVGQQDGLFYFVMEYVDGRNLAEWLHDTGPLPLQHTIHYLIQAATGLAYAHQHGVIHRNIKPQNLLVDNQTGVIKVVGMGLARLADYAVMTNAGEYNTEPGRRGMGTVDYMAPEQFLDASKANARSDIYALGCTLFHLLTGQLPYPAKGSMNKVLAHQRAPIPSLQATRTDAPLQLDLVFQKIVAKRPDDRYASMEDVAEALEHV